MNTRDKINACLSGAREQKHENYDAFLADMAEGIAALASLKDITLLPRVDPRLAGARQKVIEVAAALEQLPADLRDQLGRQSCATTILLGEELCMREVGDIDTAVFILAGIWYRHFGKWPSAGGNSRFYGLCKLVPKLQNGNKTVQKALSRHMPKELVSKSPQK